MALFDLRCNNCKQEFNTMVAFSKLQDVKCPFAEALIMSECIKQTSRAQYHQVPKAGEQSPLQEDLHEQEAANPRGSRIYFLE